MGIRGFRLSEVNAQEYKSQGIPHNTGITIKKAKTILKEGEIGGKVLTSKQKGFFGARAGGLPIKRG